MLAQAFWRAHVLLRLMLLLTDGVCSRLSADVCCAGLQRDAAHTVKLLKALPGDVCADIFAAFTAHFPES